MKAVICDLDGTLFDCQHRLHHVSGHKKNWDAFFEGIPDDPVVEPVLAVVRAMILKGFAIVITTGRPEKCRTMTEDKLDEHAVPYTMMYMRPDMNTRPDHVVKAELYEKIKNDGYDVILAIDDRKSIVDLWRSLGICTLQCAPYDDLGPATGILTLLVGPSGSGKTTYADNNLPFEEWISSDQVRDTLCGDFRDQSRNGEVFAAVHAVAKARIMHGLNATVDATSIRRADRLGLVALARGGPVRYLVFDRPLEDKIRDGGWRNEIVLSNGKGLIEAHDQTFKSNLKDILNGDGMENVTVIDHRS